MSKPLKISGGAQHGTFSAFGYQASTGRQIVTLWRDSEPPGKRAEMEHVTLTVPHGDFQEPVWVDMLSGKVYEIDGSLWEESQGVYTFKRVAVYDSVILIADRGTIPVDRVGRPESEQANPNLKQRDE